MIFIKIVKAYDTQFYNSMILFILLSNLNSGNNIILQEDPKYSYNTTWKYKTIQHI